MTFCQYHFWRSTTYLIFTLLKSLARLDHIKSVHIVHNMRMRIRLHTHQNDKEIITYSKQCHKLLKWIVFIEKCNYNYMLFISAN